MFSFHRERRLSWLVVINLDTTKIVSGWVCFKSILVFCKDRIKRLFTISTPSLTIVLLIGVFCACLGQKPCKDHWGRGLDAMKEALSLEKYVYQSLLDLHVIAANANDPQVHSNHSLLLSIFHPSLPSFPLPCFPSTFIPSISSLPFFLPSFIATFPIFFPSLLLRPSFVPSSHLAPLLLSFPSFPKSLLSSLRTSFIHF